MGKVTLVPNLSCLFSVGTIGAHHGARDEHLSTRFSLKMVSTHSRVRVNKQADAGPSEPASITLDLVAILDGQAKMQQELTDLKKRSADEMEVLWQENSRLRQKIEADPTLKGKAKETSEVARSPTFQPTEEESEYNPTPHNFTTTEQTPIPSTHPYTAAPTPTATLPTTQIPYNIPTTLHTTHVPPYNPQYPPTSHIPPHNLTSTFPAMITHPIPPHLLPPHQLRRRHPFTDFIANTHLPTQWEPFTLDRYTGKTDPEEHLKVYITHVALYTSQDTVFCKAFPTTLKGPALKWFTTLPPYSIDSFDVLSHMFSTHFAGSRPHQTTTISLLGIRQEQGKHEKEYKLLLSCCSEYEKNTNSFICLLTFFIKYYSTINYSIFITTFKIIKSNRK